MKTIMINGTYERVSDEIAHLRVRAGAKYVPKSEWKINVRNIPSEEKIVETIKAEKTKSAKVEKRLKLKEKQRA